MWKPLIKLLKIISSNTDPGAIAAGFSAGILLGFMPKNNLLWYILSIFIIFLYIQRTTFLLAMALGSILSVFLDPTFNQLGIFILSNEKLIPFFSAALDIPFVSLTKFNNSVVMGSLICGIVFYIPLFFLVKFIVILWRKYVAQFFQNSKLFKLIKKVPLVSKIKVIIESDID